jgi:hypothetical protein
MPGSLLIIRSQRGQRAFNRESHSKGSGDARRRHRIFFLANTCDERLLDRNEPHIPSSKTRVARWVVARHRYRPSTHRGPASPRSYNDRPIAKHFIATAMEATTRNRAFFDQHCFGQYERRRKSCWIAIRSPETKHAFLLRPRPRQRHNH